MGKPRSPNRDKAFKIFMEHNGEIANREIARILKEKTSNISSWKNQDRWKNKVPHKKRGAPKGNLNSLKHGIYCNADKRLPNEFIKKWFPTGLKNAYNESENLDINKIDKLGHLIDILWAKILVSQKITAVKNKKDLTKELKKESLGNTDSKAYEIQFAWDKQNDSLDVDSKAMERLSKMINTYEELIHKNWDLASEEQKTRISKMKAELCKISSEDGSSEDGKIKEMLEGVINGL